MKILTILKVLLTLLKKRGFTQEEKDVKQSQKTHSELKKYLEIISQTMIDYAYFPNIWKVLEMGKNVINSSL